MRLEGRDKICTMFRALRLFSRRFYIAADDNLTVERDGTGTVVQRKCMWDTELSLLWPFSICRSSRSRQARWSWSRRADEVFVGPGFLAFVVIFHQSQLALSSLSSTPPCCPFTLLFVSSSDGREFVFLHSP